MLTATLTYLGDLRTQAEHARSGAQILTDAPVDNHGKGEAFSPTDLLAAAYVSCMLTIIGIRIQKGDLPPLALRAEVQKVMAAAPRRVGALVVQLHVSGAALTPAQKQELEHAALTCPVALSLSEAMEKRVEFIYA